MNWEVYTKLSTLQVQIHWAAAVLSFVLGLLMLVRKKGTSSHKMIGRVYLVLMLVTCLSAFFVRSLDEGEQWSLFSNFSWIHLLIILTLFYLALGFKQIRQGNVKGHAGSMVAAYVGGLIIAGAFTFLPGRHMHTLFFGDPEAVQESIDRGLKH